MIDIRLLQRAVLKEEFHFGIVISFVENTNRQRCHLGVLTYESEATDPRYIHLAFHSMLKNDGFDVVDNNRHFIILCPSLDEDEQLQLAIRTKKVFDKNKHKVPYSIAYGQPPFFDHDGQVTEQSAHETGFTCATFVMSLFNDMGYDIIDLNSWQIRDDDGDWQEEIVKTMAWHQSHNPALYPDKSHVANQNKFIRTAHRYRPEEVAASAHVHEFEPIEFNQAVELGQSVVRKMREFLV